VRHRDSSNSAIPVSNFHFPEVAEVAEVPEVMTRLEKIAISTLSHNLHICTWLTEIPAVLTAFLHEVPRKFDRSKFCSRL
jgi:hypothetical protein